MSRRFRAHVLLFAAFAPVLASGCASAGKLAEYDFRDRTVAAVQLNVPRPEILTGTALDLDVTNPVQAALGLGADLIKEVEASRARPRLDEAARTADVGGRMIDRTLRGVAAELRAVPVDDLSGADFELEVRVKRFGIDADAWLEPAHFFIESELILREAGGGREIWKGKVTEREQLTASASGLSGAGVPSDAIDDVLTAAALSDLSTERMAGMLEALADFAADRMLDRFHRGLEKARG